MAVAFLVDRDRGDDANAHLELDIGLDHVGVHRGQHHLGLQAGGGEGFIDVRAPGVADLVGDDRVPGQVMQRELATQFQQRMCWRQHDAVAPAVAGQGDQLLVAGQRLGRDADVGLARDQHLGHLLRAALVQVQGHARPALAEVAHRVWQRVARLRVGGGDRQPPLLAALQLLARAPEAVGIEQHALDDRQQRLAGAGQAQQTLARAHEQLDAELLLELAHLATDSRLRSVQRGGHLGQVEAAAHRLAHRSELLEVHLRV